MFLNISISLWNLLSLLILVSPLSSVSLTVTYYASIWDTQ